MSLSDAEHYCPSCGKSFGPTESRCPSDGTDLITLAPERSDEDLVGAIIDDRFEVLEVIGEGGMGKVYRARQLSVGREVALKVITGQFVRNRENVKRFLREAKLTSQIQHPNSVMVLDFGQRSDGMLYLVMELIKGQTLNQLLKAEGKLSGKRVLTLGAQICDALDAAHQLDIIHRDLKPGNVISVQTGSGRERIKVLDFGLAKSLSAEGVNSTVTRVGTVCGTPAYMAPEAASGGDVDGRSDLYALGVVMYELYGGRLPFRGDTTALLMHHLSTPPGRIPDAPDAFWAVLSKLLAKKPGQRYPSAAVAADALRSAAAELKDEIRRPNRETSLDLGHMDTVAGVATPLSGAHVDDSGLLPTQALGRPISAETPPMTDSISATRIVSASRSWTPWVLVVIAVAVAVFVGTIRETSPEVETEDVAQSSVDATGSLSVPDSKQEAMRPPPAIMARSAEGNAQRRARSAYAQHPENVLIELVSEPVSQIKANGVPLGSTPHTYRAQWSQEKLVLTFHRKGRRTVTKTVVPNSSQRIKVSLPRRKAKGPSFIVPR